MNITLTLTAAPELMTVLQAIAGGFTGTTSSKKTPAKADKNVDAAPAASAQPATTAAPAAPSVNGAGDSGTTLEMVRAEVQKKAVAGKRNELKTLLGEFGVQNATSLKPEQYDSFMEKVKAL